MIAGINITNITQDVACWRQCRCIIINPLCKKIINLLETQGWDEGGNGDLR